MLVALGGEKRCVGNGVGCRIAMMERGTHIREHRQFRGNDKEQLGLEVLSRIRVCNGRVALPNFGRMLSSITRSLAIHCSLLVFVSVAAAIAATPPATNSAPARRIGPAFLRSPEILSDGRVTFRLRTTNATQVSVQGQWTGEQLPMSQDTQGVWSVTAPKVEPGVWEYSFVMNGFQMIDPVNPVIKPMREPRTSILHVAGKPPLIHDFQEVPHGIVHQHTYFSKVLGRQREFAVYTPPGYDASRSARFPTLYLQHGFGDNQATWTAHGKAHWILDNLIAQRKARPMVIVMMDGHAIPPTDTPPMSSTNSIGFERDLLEEVLPRSEAMYRLKASPAHRALVGLSMGGEQSLRIGLNHTEQFSWVGGFSAATPSKESIAKVLENASAVNQKLKLLWIACGKDDFLLQRNEEFIALLKANTIRHEWRLTEGNHSWPVWRVYLAELAPKLFQP